MQQIDLNEIESILIALKYLEQRYSKEGQGTEAININDLQYKFEKLEKTLRHLDLLNHSEIKINMLMGF